jgi:hypothetical protein
MLQPFDMYHRRSDKIFLKKNCISKKLLTFVSQTHKLVENTIILFLRYCVKKDSENIKNLITKKRKNANNYQNLMTKKRKK